MLTEIYESADDGSEYEKNRVQLEVSSRKRKWHKSLKCFGSHASEFQEYKTPCATLNDGC